MFRLMQETPGDRDEVEYLMDLAFAPGRTALSSYQLRNGVDPIAPLCLAARDEFDVVAGAIRYWPVVIGDRRDPALLLGPIAVHPTRQGEGLGSLLMLDSLHIATELGWTRVLLVGDAPYYARFGFSSELTARLDFPKPYNPDRLLGRALSDNAFAECSGLVQPYS